MSLPISVTYTFATATSSIPLSQLDANFTTVVNGINGIGNGTNALANVNITGGNAIVSSLTSPIHNSSTTLSLQTGGTTGLYIDGSQKVSIGTSTPYTRLNIFSPSVSGSNEWNWFNTNTGGALPNSNITTGIALGGNYSNGNAEGNIIYGNYLTFAKVTGSAYLETMRIDSSGNLLVGTTSALGKFTSLAANGGAAIATNNTSGTANYYGALFYNNGSSTSLCGTISISGTTTAYNTSSDYRLKTNVTPLTTAQSGPIIDALKPSQFTWTTDNTPDVGFIAHEMQAVIPKAVTGEKDAVDAEGKPVYQQVVVSSPEIIAYLVAEIQSLRARLKAANIA